MDEVLEVIKSIEEVPAELLEEMSDGKGGDE